MAMKQLIFALNETFFPDSSLIHTETPNIHRNSLRISTAFANIDNMHSTFNPHRKVQENVFVLRHKDDHLFTCSSQTYTPKTAFLDSDINTNTENNTTVRTNRKTLRTFFPGNVNSSTSDSTSSAQKGKNTRKKTADGDSTVVTERANGDSNNSDGVSTTSPSVKKRNETTVIGSSSAEEGSANDSQTSDDNINVSPKKSKIANTEPVIVQNDVDSKNPKSKAESSTGSDDSRDTTSSTHSPENNNIVQNAGRASVVHPKKPDQSDAGPNTKSKTQGNEESGAQNRSEDASIKNTSRKAQNGPESSRNSTKSKMNVHEGQDSNNSEDQGSKSTNGANKDSSEHSDENSSKKTDINTTALTDEKKENNGGVDKKEEVSIDDAHDKSSNTSEFTDADSTTQNTTSENNEKGTADQVLNEHKSAALDTMGSIPLFGGALKAVGSKIAEGNVFFLIMALVPDSYTWVHF